MSKISFSCLVGFLLCIQQTIAQINVEQIDIIRDKWGVPHIFAPTDNQVAYGFAWATCEDDFKTVQEQILPALGLAGRVLGKESVVADILVHLLDAERTVKEKYMTEVSPAFRSYLEAYAAGVNAYAKLHPEEVLHKKIFPMTGEKIIKAFVMGVSLMANTQNDMVRLLGNKVKAINIPQASGSNTFAFSSSKTVDGKTYLAINAHQPLEGPNSWYEAHLHSEEGMNILGACFPGSPVISVGANEYLGWAHTLNYADFSDIFQLEMHPTEKHSYKFDGKWEKLEKFNTKAKIKVLGFLRVGKKQKFFKSKYGVTFETENGYFAVRAPASRDVQSAEQWYRMGKSTNWKEFNSALEMQAFPSMNLAYADVDDNIFYISNGKFPKRKKGFNWKEVVPGNTSTTLWPEEYYPLDSLPHVLNPPSGYVYNCNHSPFLSSSLEDNPPYHSVPQSTGHQPPERENNRSVRFKKLIDEYDKISYDDFKRIKYDRAYHKPLLSAPKLEPIFHLDKDKYADIKKQLEALAAWDRETTIDSEAAGIFILALRFIGRQISSPIQYASGEEINEEALVSAVRYARNHIREHFQKDLIPLGELQRHSRGSVSLPVSGGPDVLAALHCGIQEDGTLRPRAGDSYIELVKFSKQGVEIESVHAYGASAKSNSPHYTDQMEMYVNRELKKMTLDKQHIYDNAVRNYHPGKI